MAYMGTHVTGGNGQGVVVATAKATELGQIQTMVGEAEAPATPMQKQLDDMGTQLALLSGAVCAGVFVVGIARGFSWLEMLKSSVSLAVAAVPEGLPAVATTTLAMGIKDMRSRNVAVRHLTAVETLGSVQVFCLDKTGTLTMNRMAVVAVSTGESSFAVTEGVFVRAGLPADVMASEEIVRLMQVVSLCSETVIVGREEMQIEGSATETALVEMAINAGIDISALREQFPTLKARHRAEGRPYMSTLHSGPDGKHILAVKGSPEEVLEMSDYYMKDGEKVRLTQAARDNILAENERMAGDALRVLGVAYKELTSARMPRTTGNLVWLGLTGMADPMRTGMNELMSLYHQAGIKTVMITGDQSATAQAIGRQLGLSEGRPLNVMESGALENIDPELLAGLVKDVHVFARVSPAHKLKIVRALQEAGNVVAMTGDGINDGPALKAADIGVAMGESGTDVAREVSDVVLEDDNLHTMEVAVRQGRTIYNNIRKTIHFMVSTNLTEIEVMLAGIAAGVGQPMNPMQLLWINLVTDIFPGLALSMEPAEPDVMERPPRDPDEAIISGRDLKSMVVESGIIGVGTMAAFLYGRSRYGAGAPQAATMAFTSLTLNELAHAISSRSNYRILFSKERAAEEPLSDQGDTGDAWSAGAGDLGAGVPPAARYIAAGCDRSRRDHGERPRPVPGKRIQKARPRRASQTGSVGLGRIHREPRRSEAEVNHRTGGRVSENFIFTSESVTRGHPDKLCDQVSDAVVDSFLKQDPCSSIAAECAISRGIVFIAARYASEAKLDIPDIARRVIRDVGYPSDVFDADACTILTSFVDLAGSGYVPVDVDGLDELGIGNLTAKNQLTVFGYACDQTPSLNAAAHRLRPPTGRAAGFPQAEEETALSAAGRADPGRHRVQESQGEPYPQHHAGRESVRNRYGGYGHAAQGHDRTGDRTRVRRYTDQAGSADINRDQSGGTVNRRRTGHAFGIDRAQDRCRYLRRVCPAEQRSAERQGSAADRSRRRLRGALCRQEHRGRQARQGMRGHLELQRRHRPAREPARTCLRHQRSGRLGTGRTAPRQLRFPARRHRSRSPPAEAAGRHQRAFLPEAGSLRPHGPQRFQGALGEHRQGRGAEISAA